MFIRCLQEYINIVVVVPVYFHVVAIGSSLGRPRRAIRAAWVRLSSWAKHLRFSDLGVVERDNLLRSCFVGRHTSVLCARFECMFLRNIPGTY